MPIWRGVTNDWGTASNWLADGSGSGVPTSTTDAIFDALSITPCTTGTGLTALQGRACRNLITTGFTNVLTVGAAATNIGFINVSGNITLGSSALHIAGLAPICIIGTTCALDVASGFTVPYLTFGSVSGAGGTGTTTLTRSFVVTKLSKLGLGNMTVTAGSAMSIDLTNGSTGGNTLIILTNVTLNLFGTITYGNGIWISGNVTSQAGSTINLSGVLGHSGGILNLSAGTVVPGTSVLNQLGNFSLNMGTNELYSFSWTNATNGTLTLLSNIVVQSCYYYTSGGGSIISGAFNITVKGTVAQASHTHAGGKLILTGDGTSADALATFSGTTMTVTAFTLGSIINAVNIGRFAIGQTITGPGIPVGTVVVAQLTGTANSLGTYQVSNSFTLGSTAIKGVNCAILGTSGTTTIEIDALANAFAYITILQLATFRYLSTNTGAYSASTGICGISSIDFQGIGSSTRFIRNLSIGASGLSQNIIILSDVWIENLICITASGISQSGVRKLYVLGNATINNGTTATTVIQPEVVLYSSAPCAFNCAILNANITIDKVGGTVTNMNNITYGTAVGAPYTFKLTNGAFIHGSYTTVIASSSIFNTPGVSWNNITINAGLTITISSLFYIVGTLAITSGTTTFTGTAGWTCGTLTCSTASTIIVLQSGVTYTTTTSVTMLGTNAGKITMRSNAPTVSYAIWTLQNPASQSMVYVSATAIDSSLGMTIYSFGGIIGTTAPVPTLNWYNGASQGTKAFTFVS